MSELSYMEKLLDGVEVEWKVLEDVFDISAGGDVPKEALSDRETEEFNIPILSNGIGDRSLYGWTNKAKVVRPSITISARGTIGWTSYRDKPIFPIVRLLVLTSKIELNLKYAYHYMKAIENNYNVPKNGIPQLTKPMVKDIVIPIPPLNIQAEIVRILDAFTELTAELVAKLTAELVARKQQYTYYREQLFTSSDFEVVKLENLAKIYLGLTYTPTYVDDGIKFISAKNTSKDFLDLTDVKYISEEEYQRSTSNAKPKRGDVLFTRVGSNLGHPVIVDTDEELCIFVSLGFIRVDSKKVSNSYIKHWINTDFFWSQVRKNAYGAAKINLNTGWLKKFDVLLPSLPEQKRIVTVLDKFDTLTTSLTEGLPREIALRQQQYEYYRELLLSFPKAEVANHD